MHRLLTALVLTLFAAPAMAQDLSISSPSFGANTFYGAQSITPGGTNGTCSICGTSSPNTGFNIVASNQIFFDTNGAAKWSMTGAALFDNSNATGPAINGTAIAAQSVSFAPDRADTKAGFGADIAGNATIVVDNAGTATTQVQWTNALMKLGGADVALPAAQTIGVSGSRGGTDTNTAGAALVVQSGLGTGSAAGSTFTLKTPHAGSTGTTTQTANTQILLGDNVVQMPNLASSSAATTGTVCWTTSTGNLTVDTTVACLASDLRTKMNVRPLEGSALDEIAKLRPISYESRPEFDPFHLGRQIGFGAQDVAKVDPRLVSVYASGPDQGTPSGVRYMQMAALLTKALQEEQAEIVELKDEVRALKRENAHYALNAR